jgi:hypothetical protein
MIICIAGEAITTTQTLHEVKLMLRLLQWLFLGHVHKWTIVKEGSAAWESTINEEKATWTRYVMQCEICGEMKIFDAR